jgi:hypothetical protein
MNKRIKELAEQATTIEVISGRGFDTTQYTDWFDKEKFAELIIKECADTVSGFHNQFGDSAHAEIKQHFGVKE